MVTVVYSLDCGCVLICLGQYTFFLLDRTSTQAILFVYFILLLADALTYVYFFSKNGGSCLFL